MPSKILNVDVLDNELIYELDSPSSIHLKCKRRYKRLNNNNLLLFSIPSIFTNHVNVITSDITFNYISESVGKRILNKEPADQEKFKIMATMITSGEITGILIELQEYIEKKSAITIPDLMRKFETDLRNTVEEFKLASITDIKNKQKLLPLFNNFFGADTITDAMIAVGDPAIEREISLFMNEQSKITEITTQVTKQIVNQCQELAEEELKTSLTNEPKELSSFQSLIITIIRKLHANIRVIYNEQLTTQLNLWENEYFGKIDLYKKEFQENVRLALDAKVREKHLPPPPGKLTKPAIKLAFELFFNKYIEDFITRVNQLLALNF